MNQPLLEPVSSIDAYFDELGRWLDLEAAAERERLARRRALRNQADAESTGEALLGMQLIDHRTGLAGRWLLDFCKPGDQLLPMNRLKVGSPVVISNQADPQDHGIAGVVSRRRNQLLQVATENWPDGTRFRIDLSPDETTRRRQMAAMAAMRMATGRPAKLRDALLGINQLRYADTASTEFRTDLNRPQREAVQFAMAAKDLAIIHGPPGTGKTTTVSELISQEVSRGRRVLACAPSNTAVDNLLERLVNLMPGVLRVGHPARVFESLRDHTLDAIVERDPANDVIRDMRREVQQLVRSAERNLRGPDARRRRRELFAEAGQLRGQIRTLERSIVRSAIDSSDVICTTTTIDDDLLGQARFDLVVIDEACQCTLPSVWQSVIRAERIVLAGDHCQLPPTVLSSEATRAGMQKSMMERIVEREGDSVFRRLKVQYRMHEQIMRFSSEHFYDDSLTADETVVRHRLCDLPGVESTRLTTQPVEFFDTAGAEYDEQVEPDGESKLNRGEAQLIVNLVTELIDAGVAEAQIGVIAPYAAQVRLLRNMIQLRDVEIDTVDGFQGREKEAVLLTMVRSNQQSEIGFLGDTRRTNVALTRARRKLLMVGDSATLGGHPFYRALLEYFESIDSYRTVWEIDS